MTDVLTADYAIRQLHGRYIDAIWRKDSEAFAGCFTDDGEWRIAGLHLRGRAEIAGAFEKLIAPARRVLMFVTQPVLEIGDGTATGRVYITEYVKRMDGEALRTIGVYYDRYAGEGLRWSFRSRQFDLQYRGPADFSEPFLDSPDYGPAPAMPG